MGYLSMRGKKEGQPEKGQRKIGRTERLQVLMNRPVLIRIMDVLRRETPRTQREIGRELYMSNAAVHYHLKKLLESGLVEFVGTRPGPKGITEKLFIVNEEAWEEAFHAPAAGKDLGFYLNYAVAWMQERHREGVELVRRKKETEPFIAGSFIVGVPPEALVEFKHHMEVVLGEFFERYGRDKGGERANYSVSFALLPSTEEGIEDSMNVVEFEPGKI